ncbi:MAG: head-tail adaptor protein [Clostridia bacterium]|nr:head-tail adaptor protein [Clostridia bacterium]
MSEREKTLYNKKALDQIRSPEQMNGYLKVTTPQVWIILAAVIFLLAGLLAWASVGELETTVRASAVIENGTARITLRETAYIPLTSDMKIRIGNQDYSIARVEKDERGRQVAYAPIALEAGTYDVKVVLETVSPLSFLIR